MTKETHDSSEPAFPSGDSDWEGGPYYPGMSLRDWFAATAPEPTEEEYKFEFEKDRMADPHNDRNARRNRREIRAQFKFAHADAMLAEREKGRTP